MPKIFLKTFGCGTNIYDSGLIKGYTKDFKLTNNEKEADIVLINSCIITDGADSGLKTYINSLKKNNIKVILMGCAAVSKGKELLDNGAISGVLGASNKARINEFLKEKKRFYEPGNLNFIDKGIVEDYENHTKAFVRIQEGCDFNCSHHTIPSVRGRSRSVKESDLLEQIKILIQNGYTEIVLAGINIGSYGLKDGTTLGKLLQKMMQISGLKRIRLGSLEPAQIDESFMEILDEKLLERHLHIVLQHTSETVLRIVRRRSHTKDDLRLFQTLASKGSALETDFIVGHPGESEELWQEALRNFTEFKLIHLHAFIFSPRNNTHSATPKGTTKGDLAKERLNTLKAIVQKDNFEFRKANKIKLEVLMESKKNGFYEGYDQFFNKVKIKSEKESNKMWLNIEDYELKGEFNETRI